MKGTSPSCTLHRHCSVKINEEERKINEEEKCNITSTSTILHRHCTVGLVKNSTEPSKNQEKTNLYLLLKKSQIPSENTAFRKFDKQYFVFFLYRKETIVVVFAVCCCSCCHSFKITFSGQIIAHKFLSKFVSSLCERMQTCRCQSALASLHSFTLLHFTQNFTIQNHQ